MEENTETKSVASIIEDAMKAKSMSVEKLSLQSGISERFIELIVKEKVGKLPSSPYVRGYISKIADILNLNKESLWAEYKKQSAEKKVEQSPEKSNEIKNGELIKKFINTKSLVIIGIILGLVIVIILRGSAFIGKPTLSLENYDDNISVSTSTFAIKGRVDPKNQITINDETVFPDESGLFEKNFTLTSGFNTFNFKVRGILGKELQMTKQVYLTTSTKKTEKQVEPVVEINTSTTTQE